MTEEEKKKYQQSQKVTQAQESLTQHTQQKPGAYQSQYQAQKNDLMQQIQNRPQFQFDVNADALYNQYKDQYIQNGRLAMMDTMGQAAALTGGYGNSYAQQAGQQAYQGYLTGLTDQIPDLYQAALSRYLQEGQDLKDQYSMLADLEDQEFSRYQQEMNAWLTERDYLADRADAERDYDYNQYMQDLAWQYQLDRDQIGDQQWQTQFDEDKRRYDQEWAEAHPEKSTGGGSTGGVQYTPYTPPKEEPKTDTETTPLPGQLTEAQWNAAMDGYLISGADFAGSQFGTYAAYAEAYRKLYEDASGGGGGR